MRRSLLAFVQATCLFLIALVLWAGSERWGEWRLVSQHLDCLSPLTYGYDIANTNNSIVNSYSNGDQNSSVHPGDSSDVALPGHLIPYVQAILHPANTTLPILECPSLATSRYEYLQADTSSRADHYYELKYFFALDLRQSIGVVPRLLGSIVEAIKFLGPASCALSIVEGNSEDDGTYEVLRALRPEMERLGIAYYALQSSAIDPAAGDRIAKLAQLRNMALLPLISPSSVPASALSSSSSSTTWPTGSASTSIIFLNDVAPCVTDILELVHQRLFQSAHMTCGMDWTYVGRDPTFYDVVSNFICCCTPYLACLVSVEGTFISLSTGTCTQYLLLENVAQSLFLLESSLGFICEEEK